jgi:pimeloyl-ACP methyl ester carboxylesterase
MGGMTALRLAMKHPDRVRKLVVVSAGYNEDSFYPSIRATWPHTTADALVGTPMEEVYLKTAPDSPGAQDVSTLCRLLAVCNGSGC